jgi:hypothetical protein
MPIRNFLVCASILALAAGCVHHYERMPADMTGWVGEITSYNKVVSKSAGTVGYLKVFRYTKKGYGEPFELYHVYDLDFRERGIVEPRGTATKYIFLPPAVAEVKETPVEKQALGAQPLPWNVALILESPKDLKIVPATAADLKRQ